MTAIMLMVTIVQSAMPFVWNVRPIMAVKVVTMETVILMESLAFAILVIISKVFHALNVSYLVWAAKQQQPLA